MPSTFQAHMTQAAIVGAASILRPVIALAIWTNIMWAWMYAIRNPALMAHPKVEIGTAIGFTGAQLDALLPAKTQWKAHNYNHLHEQPTIFYATALTLALLGAADGLKTTLAWAYTGLRIIHSLYQALINRATMRFAIFTCATIALWALIFRAGAVLIK